MEAAAALHVHRIDPELRVALRWAVPGATDTYRAKWSDGENVRWGARVRRPSGRGDGLVLVDTEITVNTGDRVSVAER